MQVSPLEPSASDHLNMIRGLSALAVLFSHVRGLFFQDLKNVVHPDSFTYLLYAVTGLGHQAVMVFFVLSGFFVAGSAIKMADRWSWRKYLGNRLIRLYLVLLPALVLTTIVDQVSIRMPLGQLYFLHPIYHFNAEPVITAISIPTFLGNALFLQTIVVRPFGSDAPLWSLSNEFWYYILFPLILISFYHRWGTVRIFYIGLAAALAFLLPSGMVLYFLIWLLGAAMHLVRRPRLRAPLLSLLRMGSFGVFVLFLILARFNRLPDVLSDFCVGFSFAMWMFCLLEGAPSRIVGLRGPLCTRVSVAYSSFANRLAGCSYSVYAINLPLLMFARTAITAKPWQPTPAYLTIGLLIGICITVIGYLFSRITEAKTDSVRIKVFAWSGIARARELPAEVGASS
jgi:peptidoglycan/LPS O-acetylase OafA/YrhL